MSTHSKHIIDELQEKSKIHWIKDGKLIKEDERDIINIFMEIGALDKGELLIGKKVIVLTEDSTEQEMLVTLLESSGLNMTDVDIWAYSGCTNIESATLLASFIRKHNPNIHVILHRDRDYFYDDEIDNIKNEVEKSGIKCFITKYTDIESYYLDAVHVNTLYPELDLDKCENIVNTAKAEAKDISIEKFINSRTPIELKYARKKGKTTINNGELALKCQKEYENDINRYSYGKKSLGYLKSILQEELKQNINLIKPSITLCDDNLKKLITEI